MQARCPLCRDRALQEALLRSQPLDAVVALGDDTTDPGWRVGADRRPGAEIFNRSERFDATRSSAVPVLPATLLDGFVSDLDRSFCNH